jgi:hypothetical protein
MEKSPQAAGRKLNIHGLLQGKRLERRASA